MRAGSGGRWVRLVLTQLGCILAIAVMTGVAVAAEPPKYELRSSFGPDGTEATGFSGAASAAVDQQSGAVYVSENKSNAPEADSLLRFDSDGKPLSYGGSAPYISGNRISGLTLSEASEHQVAVDSASHEIYITDANTIRAFQANGEPAVFSAGPGSGTSKIGGFTNLAGVAVDVNGSIYASDLGAGTVTVFSSSGALITQFSTTEPANLAVNADGVVYVDRVFANPAGTVRKYTPSSFPVTGTTTYTAAAAPLSPFGSFTVAVDPETNYVYVSSSPFIEGQFKRNISVFDENDVFLTSFAGPGEEGAVTFSVGVAPGGKEDRVFVTNQPGVGVGLSQTMIFEPAGTPEKPTIESISATAVTGDTAVLHAKINPNTAETTYYFEYGLEDCSISACAKVPVDGGSIEAGVKGVLVSEPIFGLQAGTTYHYRVVAENKFGLTDKFGIPERAGRTFTTQSPGADFQLSDSRVWEMVSPPNKRGGQLTAGLQAAADGNGVSFLSVGTIETDPDGNRALIRSSVLARRGPAGWESEDITPANSRFMPWVVRLNTEYRVFTPDLATGLLEPSDGTQLSPKASERTPYLRINTKPPVYEPLVTGKEGFANVPPGTEFGGSLFDSGAVSLAGANAGLSHLALGSLVPLSPGAPSGALYHWTGGQLQPLSVLPADEGGATIGTVNVGSGKGSVRGAVSEDGSRIFWQRGTYGAAGNHLTALFLRDTAAQETFRLDVVQPGATGAGGTAPIFQGASPDGTVVFFTDTQQLTEGASPKGQDLYRCEIPPGSPSSGCAGLTNLTSSTASPGESGEVLGLVSGMSEDATGLYFVAKGVLDAAPNESGAAAESGKPNLYHWQEGEGTRFIATLGDEDSQSWGLKGSTVAETSTLSAVASPSGRYFSFMSQMSLTGENNLNPANDEGVERVFRYDAVEDRLTCISCGPTGAAPEGQIAPNGGRPLADPVDQWEGRWVAAILPTPMLTESAGTVFYRSRSVLDNGRVFFNSFDGLVPADSNGEWDVYQFEPVGVGSCDGSTGNPATATVPGGCVSLISSGDAAREAGFLDASVSGDDVFFFTPARLSVTDKDAQLDVYDARVNGTPAVLAPASECSGGACRSPGQPPTYTTPASETFKGHDSVRRRICPKGKRKVRRGGKVRCVPKSKGKKKPPGKRAGQSGRAGR